MNRITDFSFSLLIILVLVLSGCRTTKRFTNETHVSRADSTATIQIEQGRVVDSTSISSTVEQWRKQTEQRTEKTTQSDVENITERITTTTDSTGTTTRVEERNISRRVDKSTIAEINALTERYRREIDSIQRSTDSLQQIINGYAHWEKADSTHSEKQLQSKPSVMAWSGWWMVAVFVGITMLLVFVVRKYLK